LNAPEAISSMVGSFGASLQSIEGKCEQHGAASVLVRAGMAWYCPACQNKELRVEYGTTWAGGRHQALHAIADIPVRYRGQQFRASTPAHKAARAMAKSFHDCVTVEGTWATLVLTGQVGTGKTQLACELAEAYINKFCRSVRYVTAKGMISEIQASYGKEGKSEDSEIDRFVQYDMLILDEIDAIPAKDNAVLLLTEIINRRYGNNKPMIVISNQAFDGLAKFIGDRVVDRLHENAFVCLFDWPSFRRQP
jgi:DNA replication protein DnaC